MNEGAGRPWAKRMAAGRRAAAVLAVLLLLALVGLWSQRKPIARGFVDRALRAHGVPARYTIEALGPGVQRLRDVSIGDPAAPDLVAKELVLRLHYGFGLPQVTAVEGRGVRLRARLADGRLSLGAVDRLLPKPNGAPFTLPDIALTLANAVVALETPAGPVTLGVSGAGRLTGGFTGRVHAGAARLATGGCRMEDVTADLVVGIAGRRPRLTGPVVASAAACGEATAAAPRLRVDAVLEEALSLRTADLTLATGRLALGAESVATAGARLTYAAADPRDRHGALALNGRGLRTRYGIARTLRWAGSYRVGGRVGTSTVRPLRAEGRLALGGATLPMVVGAGAHADTLGGTPLAPVGAALARAVAAAGRDADLALRAAFDGDLGRDAHLLTGEARVWDATLASRSGARAALAGDGLRFSTDGGTSVNGAAALSGGGLPTMRVMLRQSLPSDALDGVAMVAPYAVGDARLALAPVRFRRAGRRLRLDTVATVDGPLGDGRVRGLTLPIALVREGDLRVNAACVPLTFDALSIAGMDLGRTRLPLCPVGGAMLRVGNGRIGGGMAVPYPHLRGRVGRQPLTLAARDMRVDLAGAGFTVDALAVRLGGEEGTRLDVANLAGRTDRRGVGGAFGGAAGAIANVPLLLADGAGRWRLERGSLTLGAAATVSDADASPRFLPMRAPDIALNLTGGVIRVVGTLREPTRNVAVTDVTIRHDLRDGAGHATLDVPGITFGLAFQPEAITPLTLGIVANVAGTVRGQGRIAWNGRGVTSTGDFATEGLDLAAAFGPVTGISTRLHFDDLLGLATPPGQIVTVAAFNPGVAVEGGVIGYQLLPGLRVAVGGGKWPFSGGALILEPTVLDFGQEVPKHLTFRVEGLDAARFLERFDFKNIAATGLFDGELPMVFDKTGGRIEGGRLVVRPPGGTLAYVGELTNRDLGMLGKLAFDALKFIRYSNLRIELDGALDSEVVSRIVFTGTNENPRAEKPKGLLGNLTGLPFRFNIVVRAPFRGLTSTAEGFADPRALIGRAAPPPADAVAGPLGVKPPVSEDVR